MRRKKALAAMRDDMAMGPVGLLLGRALARKSYANLAMETSASNRPALGVVSDRDINGRFSGARPVGLAQRQLSANLGQSL
jgi:hypothetical protein